MDLFDLLATAGLVTTAVVSYLIFFRRSAPIKLTGNYREPGWNYLFRLLLARFAVKRWKSRLPLPYSLDTTRENQSEGWDSIVIRGSAPDGSTVFVSVRKIYDRPLLAEATVHIKLADGTTYKLPQHPDTITGQWEYPESGWNAGGLKIEILEHRTRLRILYNGLLKRQDGVVQHAKFNMIWSAASAVNQFPDDWSNKLAAQALALEPWRDAEWPSALGKWNDGSWLQWGAVQGRFESFTSDGAVDRSEYLRARGVRERCWAPTKHAGLRRHVTLTAAATDGTGVQLKAFSYNDVLTLGYSGCVRVPDGRVESLTGTDFVLPEFCEQPDSGNIPDVFTINVSTKSRTLKLLIRTNKDEGTLVSGVPYRYKTVYCTAQVDIDGYVGTGLLELGYQHIAKGPSVTLPQHRLRWTSELDIPRDTLGYCAPFDAPAAACNNYVGGKGASLALLATVQKPMGYKVPPGYCLTIKALEKHLEANPALSAAIAEIEAANVNYDENKFKSKCNKAVELFVSTEIVKDVKEEILSHLQDLRKKAQDQNLGPELRFAVRSSAVGEDSEALSAAGQNETILGCKSDEDVLKGVQQCWGSMFAFTSAYYRRQNGQRCRCGGGVVVQALVRARTAGVMFTRHPAHGDPSRLLLTANYGLGETVVSGTVEPDTITVSRGKELTIASIELGSKKQRATADGAGMTLVDVSEEERKLPCLTVTEILALAKIGVAQEEAWGAGRDIEWAVTKDDIYLLQARPITSLERWTEEELLHEFDTPIMSDDDLTTFANTGEVIPRPVTALSYDLMALSLKSGIGSLFGSSTETYDYSLTMTHNRVTFDIYNSLLKIVSNAIDLTVRMSEMSICGHLFIDERIFSVAQHRRPPSKINSMLQTIYSFKYLLTTGSHMKDAIKVANDLKINTDSEDMMELLTRIKETEPKLQQCIYDHAVTSAGSSIAQFIAMMTLVEGRSDFTNDQCNEISTLLSSGSVLSAEVPQELAKIARKINESGKAEEFRAQPPKQAMDWLNINLPAVFYHVSEFLEQHGHRAIMEFDLSTKPWAIVPKDMIEVLQSMRVVNEEKRHNKTDAEIVDSLKTPQKPNTRKVLRWILPLCRRTVQHRETTKAHTILVIHKMRLVARRLGQLMVKNWFLPDEDLLFHFRSEELRNYLLYRDPALLRKASQRRQYYSSWCKLKFAEMQRGWPQPLKERPPAVIKGDVRLEATAVCGGEIVARACVIKDISEIDQLQAGDVLVTHCTDIGWSPYFPLLSGIVTELGGLISHGAVIAREYGLPCLVGAGDATYMFKTGDMVRLSATEGVLEKVQIHDKPTTNETDNTETLT